LRRIQVTGARGTLESTRGPRNFRRTSRVNSFTTSEIRVRPAQGIRRCWLMRLSVHPHSQKHLSTRTNSCRRNFRLRCVCSSV